MEHTSSQDTTPPQTTSESASSPETEESLYKIEVIPFDGRTITIVHIEHEMGTKDSQQKDHQELDQLARELESDKSAQFFVRLAKSDISRIGEKGGRRPENWKSILQEQITNSSVVFVEYFPAEIYREAGSNKAFGWLVDRIMKDNITPFFHTVSAMAGISSKHIGVADIANRVAYEMYELGGAALSIGRKQDYKGHATEPSQQELQWRSAIDARRLFTAEGLAQEARHRKEGSNILYIAPPAHASRVAKYLQLISIHDRDMHKKAMHYRLRYPGLDSNVRLYSSYRSRPEWEAFLLSEPDNLSPTNDERLRIEKALYPAVDHLVAEKERQMKEGWKDDDDQIRLSLEELLECRKAVCDWDFAEARRILANDKSWNRYASMPIKPQ